MKQFLIAIPLTSVTIGVSAQVPDRTLYAESDSYTIFSVDAVDGCDGPILGVK
ncbi:MAG: hypothetical protein ABW318_00090 [Vicinamibacterales bacterium]